MNRKKNLRRLSVLVTAQTLYNLQRLADMTGIRNVGRVVDKLTREKMLALKGVGPDVADTNVGGADDNVPTNQPLTQTDVDELHFDRVWIDYGVREDGEREGEEGVVLYGKLYSIDALEGAGFEEMLLDLAEGETLDCPSGNYTVYSRPPEGDR